MNETSNLGISDQKLTFSYIEKVSGQYFLFEQTRNADVFVHGGQLSPNKESVKGAQLFQLSVKMI